jgi:hypothetical protein
MVIDVLPFAVIMLAYMYVAT